MLDKRPVWKKLTDSRKFWLAAFAVVQSVLFYFVPDFPESIWLAIDGLVAVLISTIAFEDFAEKLK